MSKNVTVIPPSERKPDTLRVAAYCRVSSDSSDQLHSYASQIRKYTEEIGQHKDWELVNIYADEVVTGTKTDKREDFNRLLADCRKGKVDRVLVKSISRFARNTKDCLTALRELMSLGVTVYIEKENINTETLTTELMVSVSGSLAQQESVSIAQNLRMACRRRMARGEFITNKPPYGYQTVGSGQLKIIPAEAEVIRWAFDAYLAGRSTNWIANELTRKGISNKQGQVHWTANEIGYWLANEKYTGNTLCQKTFSGGFPFTKRKNCGELDQFYVEGTHPAIIDTNTFTKVQILRERKKRYKKTSGETYPLAKKMVCAICGTTLYRRVGSSGIITWNCVRHLEKAEKCPTGSIRESDIYSAFVRMYNKLRLHDGIILQPALRQMEDLETAVQRENPAMLEINRAIAQATEQNYKISKLRSCGLLDDDACSAKLAALEAQLAQLRARRRRLLKNDDISEATEALRRLWKQSAKARNGWMSLMRSCSLNWWNGSQPPPPVCGSG